LKLLNKLFLNGLFVIIPISLTVYLILLISQTSENIFAPLVKKVLGPNLYIPGLGLFLTFAFIVLVGVLVSNFITGRIVKFFISQFENIPFIKTIYSPLKDLMSLFSQSSNKNMKKVVVVKLRDTGMETLGLITREEFSDIGDSPFGVGKVAVYIPMSYMVGGMTVIVNREEIREVDIPVERAFKLAITGWIKSDKDD